MVRGVLSKNKKKNGFLQSEFDKLSTGILHKLNLVFVVSK